MARKRCLFTLGAERRRAIAAEGIVYPRPHGESVDGCYLSVTVKRCLARISALEAPVCTS